MVVALGFLVLAAGLGIIYAAAVQGHNPIDLLIDRLTGANLLQPQALNLPPAVPLDQFFDQQPSGTIPSVSDPNRPEWNNLHPALVAEIRRLEAKHGSPIPISSGYRSREKQEQLWCDRHSNPYPVARPGTSNHERGLAIDVPSSFVATMNELVRDSPICNPPALRISDPIHFEYCPLTRIPRSGPISPPRCA